MQRNRGNVPKSKKSRKSDAEEQNRLQKGQKIIRDNYIIQKRRCFTSAAVRKQLDPAGEPASHVQKELLKNQRQAQQEPVSGFLGK